MFKVRAKSKDLKSKILTITYNTSKVHGGYRFDRVGIIKYFKNMYFCYVDLYKIGYWLNSGVKLKTKISWFIGMIGKYEIKMK